MKLSVENISCKIITNGLSTPTLLFTNEFCIELPRTHNKFLLVAVSSFIERIEPTTLNSDKHLNQQGEFSVKWLLLKLQWQICLTCFWFYLRWSELPARLPGIIYTRKYSLENSFNLLTNWMNEFLIAFDSKSEKKWRFVL